MSRLYSNILNVTTITFRAASFAQAALPGSQHEAGHFLIIMQQAKPEVLT